MSESVEKWIASVWAEVASELERRKTQLYEQIKNYPPPITATSAAAAGRSPMGSGSSTPSHQ